VPDTVTHRHGVTMLVCAPDGPKLRTDHDTLDLIGPALGHRARLVVLPVERLDEDFFALRTGIAGQILQKFASYRRHLVIVGDITRYLAGSSALGALVHECNRGQHAWFVTDLAELDTRLEHAAR